MASKVVPLAKMDPAARAKRIAQLASNPGTRSAIPTKYLPAQYRGKRELNDRLNAPVVQGSSLTNREVAHQARTAADVQYGGALTAQQQTVAQQQQLGKDMAGWFDEYRKGLQQSQANTQQIGDNTTSKIGQLAGAFSAPNTAGFSAENADDATKAAAVRKAILSNSGAVATAQSGAANQYANTLANVVAPTQKLQARSEQAGKVQQALEALTGLNKEKGQYEQQQRGSIASDEAKNVLAAQTLGLDTAKTKAQIALQTAQTGETARHNKASEKNTRTAAERQAQAEAGKVNSYGYTNAAWAAMSTEERRKVIKESKSSGGKSKSPWLGDSQQANFRSTVESTRALIKKFKGQYGRNELGQLLLNGRSAQALIIDSKTRKPIMQDGIPVTDLASAKKADPNAIQIKTPAIPKVSGTAAAAAISAALDAEYVGHLSKYTIDKLHTAKIQVEPLGISTKAPKPKKVRVVKGPSSGPFSTGIGPVSPVG
jgi:hypothetical protein